MEQAMRNLGVVAAGLLALAAGEPAWAVKYMPLSQAIKTFIPEGSKVFKVSKSLTAEQRKRIAADYGWEPKDEQYTFYLGKDAAGAPQSYVFVVDEAFNTCFHKYAVGMKASGEVLETVVVELSCPRAFPINKKTFLKQFAEKKHTNPLTTKLDVDAVTGATLSSESTAQATRKAVSLHNIFFGGGEAVKVSEEAKAARAKADALIQKAIQTGETLTKDGKPAAGQLPPEPGK